MQLLYHRILLDRPSLFDLSDVAPELSEIDTLFKHLVNLRRGALSSLWHYEPPDCGDDDTGTAEEESGLGSPVRFTSDEDWSDTVKLRSLSLQNATYHDVEQVWNGQPPSGRLGA